MSTEKNQPKEVSFEEAANSNTKDLKELLNEKAKTKVNMENIPGLTILKKSKFYMNGDKLREHVATYKNYAIMLKQEQLKEDDGKSKMMEVFPALIDTNLLSVMKRVNGNVIRKMQPKTLHQYEIMALVNQVVVNIDKGL
jgi:sRNA-binding regulator protein Hfq